MHGNSLPTLADLNDNFVEGVLRFGFEPEGTVKIAKRMPRVYEVGISYWGQTYQEGKKIGWTDGFRALWCLVKYSLNESKAAASTAVSEVQS